MYYILYSIYYIIYTIYYILYTINQQFGTTKKKISLIYKNQNNTFIKIAYPNTYKAIFENLLINNITMIYI